jgi:hypothetical protein
MTPIQPSNRATGRGRIGNFPEEVRNKPGANVREISCGMHKLADLGKIIDPACAISCE